MHMSFSHLFEQVEPFIHSRIPKTVLDSQPGRSGRQLSRLIVFIKPWRDQDNWKRFIRSRFKLDSTDDLGILIAVIQPYAGKNSTHPEARRAERVGSAF